MENKNEYFRHIMFFYFHKGKNAAQTHKKICAVHGDYGVSETTVREWFRHFRSGDFNCADFNCADLPCSGRPTEVDDDQIKTLIENNATQHGR